MDDQNSVPHANSGVVELAELLAPATTVTETSNPAPSLARWNIAVMLDDANDARNAVLALESLEADDAAIGFTVLTPRSTAAETTAQRAAIAEARGQTGNERPSEPGLDPEGVIADVAPRTIVGGVIGAVVGAIIVGVAAFAIAGTIGAVAGAIGGALLGAPIGAVWGGFARMGGSDAYRQTFVDPADPSTFMVSLHTADDGEADAAAERLGLLGPVVRTEYDGEHLHVASR
jgi:hypothetical protein